MVRVKMDLFDEQTHERGAVGIGPGAAWLKQWLSPDDQRALVARCHALMDGPVGGYTPTVRGGGQMRVRMMCLGRHWNPLTYTYTSTRADHDDAPVPPVPEEWVALASTIAATARLRPREAGFGEAGPRLCPHDAGFG